MCGIAGILNHGTEERVQEASIRLMSSTIASRGPDDEGVFVSESGRIGLGFRRLSIIDLSRAGHQPMPNEDESVWLVFNGEIYNFQELRARLESNGHRFRSNADSEVILHLYEDYGADCVDHLDGMFALAIWDQNRERLVLARDRIGKKPLYYSVDPKRIVFGSELKAVIANGDVDRTPDWAALGEYFSAGYVPGPQTAYKGVRKLQPGHVLEHENGVTHVRRFWDWKPAFARDSHPVRYEEWVEATRSALKSAVRKRMISDVPLGAFLSGGVDSSAVVATMAEISSEPVRTFSVGFTSAQHSELPFAREVASRVGSDHQEIIVEPERLDVILPALVRQYDEPFADSSALPSYYVCRAAREQVTVALSGDGGDEACAGYQRYARAIREKKVDCIPQGIRKMMLGPATVLPATWRLRRVATRLGHSFEGRYLSVMSQIPLHDLRHLLTPDLAREIGILGPRTIEQALFDAADLDPLSRLQYVDGVTYLPDDILVKMDRASMMNSLEVRCPLLDCAFLELMASVPPKYRLSGGDGKRLLKDAVRGQLPDGVLDRPKMGFGIPIEKWFKDDLQAYLKEILLDPVTLGRGVFTEKGLLRLIQLQAHGNLQLAYQMWAVLVFELWCRDYLDQPS